MARRWPTHSITRLSPSLIWPASPSAASTACSIPTSTRGLPAFLSPDPGLSSGFMMAQIVAAALINECQVLAASFLHGQHSHRRRQGRPRLHGHDRRAQAAADCGARRAHRGHRVDVRRAGRRVPPAAPAQPRDRDVPTPPCAKSFHVSTKTARSPPTLRHSPLPSGKGSLTPGANSRNTVKPGAPSLNRFLIQG